MINLWKVSGWSISAIWTIYIYTALLAVHQRAECMKILKFKQLQK